MENLLKARQFQSEFSRQKLRIALHSADDFFMKNKAKRPDSIMKTKPNKLICYQILPIVHQIVDENCRQFLNNYEK